MSSFSAAARALAALALTGCLAATGGCASAARPAQMTAVSAISPVAPGEPGYKAFRVANTQGGSGTNPLWMSNVSNADFRVALEASLRAANYLADQAEAAKTEITASLIDLQRPMAGLDLSVTTRVRYSAAERADGKIVYDDTIAATGTAKFGDSLIAVERLRLANEAAVKANIEAFIVSLKGRLQGGGGGSAATVN